LRRHDESARIALDRYKKKYEDKMSAVHAKMAKVNAEQKDLGIIESRIFSTFEICTMLPYVVSRDKLGQI